MAIISIEIPQQFLQPLNELVMQSGAGSSEAWVKNLIKNVIMDYQLKKDLGPEYQRRMAYLQTLWP
jgi:metal-responsive CopG/Arc/MetJ family transcriptional regulator